MGHSVFRRFAELSYPRCASLSGDDRTGRSPLPRYRPSHPGRFSPRPPRVARRAALRVEFQRSARLTPLLHPSPQFNVASLQQSEHPTAFAVAHSLVVRSIGRSAQHFGFNLLVLHFKHDESRALPKVLRSVIFNAVDALPQGGVITIITRSVTRHALHDGGSAERELQIEVRDNGIGMDEKVRQHCLEPFYTTKHKSGGTGLGLAMVYGMVKRHDGSVEIESAPNQGTGVRLIFPIRERAASSAQPQAAQSAPCRSLRILCIDDEPELRQLMHDVLEVHHHKVTVAASGREGIRTLPVKSPGARAF